MFGSTLLHIMVCGFEMSNKLIQYKGRESLSSSFPMINSTNLIFTFPYSNYQKLKRLSIGKLTENKITKIFQISADRQVGNARVSKNYAYDDCAIKSKNISFKKSYSTVYLVSKITASFHSDKGHLLYGKCERWFCRSPHCYGPFTICTFCCKE